MNIHKVISAVLLAAALCVCSSSVCSATSFIGEKRAADAALKRAGKAASDVRIASVKLSADSTPPVYSVTFSGDGMNFLCVVNAATGEVSDFSARPVRKK